MSALTPQAWRELLVEMHGRREEPFDGRRADLLLCVGVYLSTTARGDRVALKRTRELFGERLTRRYVSVLTFSGLLVMVVKPVRAQGGKPGRIALYEFRKAPSTLPPLSTERGSDNYDQKGQRAAQDATLEDPDSDPSLSVTLPLSERKASRLYLGAHGSPAEVLDRARSL